MPGDERFGNFGWFCVLRALRFLERLATESVPERPILFHERLTIEEIPIKTYVLLKSRYNFNRLRLPSSFTSLSDQQNASLR